MTAVAVAPLGQREVLQWLAPAPLWDTSPTTAALSRPWIAELRTDDFLDDFLGLLSGPGSDPGRLAELEPELTVDEVAGAPYRLFRPLSQRYYLVTATLVCRRPGIPDHRVQKGLEERATYVMRRLGAGGEEAFVPGSGGGTWVAATDSALVPGEQQHPMSAAPVAPYATSGVTAALGLAADGGPGRTLLYGYVPVGAGDNLVRPMADPVQALADLAADPPTGGVPDPVLSWLVARVVDPWRRLLLPPAPPKESFASLFLLLDLGDWLAEYLDAVHGAIMSGGSLSGAAQDLLTGLEGVTVPRSSGGSITLRQAVKDTDGFRGLLAGDDIEGPGVDYLLRSASNLGTWLGGPNQPGSLTRLAAAALTEASVAPKLPPELEGMILEPPPVAADGSTGTGPTYVIRTVFEHPPCRPVLSAATHPFELARALDPDAPARQILLQVPDITHLRKFKRGVAIETPPSLQRILDRVTPEMLKGDPLGPDPGLQLGWICAFSLQIIFLVAFIVMFIFLILLNIIFWWLPFLKICFPIPVKPSTPKAPTP